MLLTDLWYAFVHAGIEGARALYSEWHVEYLEQEFLHTLACAQEQCLA